MQQADSLRNQRKVLSKEIGGLMKQGKKDEAEATKAKVTEMADELAHLEQLEEEYAAEIKKRMHGHPADHRSDACRSARMTARTLKSSASASRLCRILRCRIMWTSWSSLNGIDIDSARRTSGNGFYYLKGDIARLHSAHACPMRATS